MPIYEYKCKSCDVKFEQLIRTMNGEMPGVRVGGDLARVERLRRRGRRGRQERRVRCADVRAMRRAGAVRERELSDYAMIQRFSS